MDYATIMVHLDASRHMHQRLHLAVQLAVEYQATLIGLLALGEPEPRSTRYLMDGDRYLASYKEWQRHAGEMARQAFLGATDGLVIPTEWRTTEWATAATVQGDAHAADLIVLGQRDPADNEAFDDPHFVESVVLQCGRPALVVPYAGAFPKVGKTILVAWNGSREAARAIHDALPFLRRAESVDVVSWGKPDVSSDLWLSPARYAVEWLSRHRVQAQLHDIETDVGNDTGEMLLSRAADLGSDLIVMGAYGHGRVRELVLGGVTRTILASMTVPVLLSH
ncbi:universal stress protein [Cupriavidus sp. WKF15]|uniref:universal stress protein n=1 Tax=Cupriavidus sp. WKF15 TaxID=3032282 RepID=UPI0023E1B924|nr:universal stress protein [Cupriavidus sp. WKF15]WER48928.1 universal stress protein [Cupriavidus sp. WKF15]